MAKRGEISRISVLRRALLGISLLMIWEALSPSSFARVIPSVIRRWIELSYFLAVFGALTFLIISIWRLFSPSYGWSKKLLGLTLELVWCLSLLLCAVLMAVR